MYASEGDSATANAAAWAYLLLLPTTKFSKLYLGLNIFSLSKPELFFFIILDSSDFLLSSEEYSSEFFKITRYSSPITSLNAPSRVVKYLFFIVFIIKSFLLSSELISKYAIFNSSSIFLSLSGLNHVSKLIGVTFYFIVSRISFQINIFSI